jgi:hypothetical protein
MNHDLTSGERVSDALPGGEITFRVLDSFFIFVVSATHDPEVGPRSPQAGQH